MMNTFRVASCSFKQAIISGGRVIMMTADEPKLLNSLYVKTIINYCIQEQCHVLSKVPSPSYPSSSA